VRRDVLVCETAWVDMSSSVAGEVERLAEFWLESVAEDRRERGGSLAEASCSSQRHYEGYSQFKGSLSDLEIGMRGFQLELSHIFVFVFSFSEFKETIIKES
jgi:hypothetical protein